MINSYETRPELLAKYIINNNSNIRSTALNFNLAKSTVHHDVSKKLKIINYPLYNKLAPILKNNFDTKHIRGGMSTKKKYEKLKIIKNNLNKVNDTNNNFYE